MVYLQKVAAVVFLLAGVVSAQYGYSYSTFSGPVSGEIRQIPVPPGHYHPYHGAATQHHESYDPKVDYVVSIK